MFVNSLCIELSYKLWRDNFQLRRDSKQLVDFLTSNAPLIQWELSGLIISLRKGLQDILNVQVQYIRHGVGKLVD